MSKCTSCGIDWTEHLGITGTCKRVQDQAAEIERLKAEIERLTKSERVAHVPKIS
jgi:archaellum component FlaC